MTLALVLLLIVCALLAGLAIGWECGYRQAEEHGRERLRRDTLPSLGGGVLVKWEDTPAGLRVWTENQKGAHLPPEPVDAKLAEPVEVQP